MANSVRAGNIPALEKHTTKRWNGLVLGWTATVQSCGTELVEPGLEMANDGHSGYVWTFSTLTERCFLRRGRSKAAVDEALDDEFAGVLVSDFNAADTSIQRVQKLARVG